MSETIKRIEADALKAKRAALEEMLQQCSPGQQLLFHRIYTDRARYEKKSWEETIDLHINDAIDLVERTIRQNAKTGRYMSCPASPTPSS
jgi:hypothetical protein